MHNTPVDLSLMVLNAAHGGPPCTHPTGPTLINNIHCVKHTLTLTPIVFLQVSELWLRPQEVSSGRCSPVCYGVCLQ